MSAAIGIGAVLHGKIQAAALAAYNEAAATLTDAVLASTTDPADAIRLLVPLCGWLPPPLAGTGALSAEARAVQAILAAQLRGAACASLGKAAQLYQPISYQDAQSVRALVCGAIDAEATRQADAGHDAIYMALRALRTAVAIDLAVRGANLALLVEVTTFVPMPSLAEAWTLYQDTTREPQLVASAAPPHPLFMPLQFNALQR
jgi:prophage DNA circulation protein